MTDRYIVSAANRLPNGEVVVGVRHWDKFMHRHIQLLRESGNLAREDIPKIEQGFVDQRGEFMTREEAWIIAVNNNQVRFVGDGFSGIRLFSENLY